MVGNIIKKGKASPDSYFDPVTHIATEENFIKFLDCGVYDSKYIGYGVTLSNSVDYNNGVWIIADVNHDSANTGQTNCYDLISRECFYSTTFGPDYTWRKSTIRTWLNGTFYGGFNSSFKARMMKPKYMSWSTWYNDDDIILPSKVELNGGLGPYYTDNEGVGYSIYNTDNSRKKKKFGYDSYGLYFTRSRVDETWIVWVITDAGKHSASYYQDYRYLTPILRVQ